MVRVSSAMAGGVVEARTEKLICEVKAASEMSDPVVLALAK